MGQGGPGWCQNQLGPLFLAMLDAVQSPFQPLEFPMTKRSARQRVADLDKFLAEAEAKQRLVACSSCANEAVRSIVSAFLDKLQAGETSISLSYLHKNMIVSQLNGPRSYESVKRHVKQCLNRDVRTGNPLEDDKPAELAEFNNE